MKREREMQNKGFLKISLFSRTVLTLAILLVFCTRGYSQTVVNSLSQLRSVVLQSNQTIVMTPGSYNWEDLPTNSRVITFSGSNNTITLTGVYVKVPVGCIRESYLTLSGNNNTIFNGEFEDVYRNGMTEVTDFSAYNQDRVNQAYGLRGDPVLRIEGTGNLVQGLKLTTRGSFPFGYGSIYGIGADNTFGLDKRCGILINGVSNTLDSVEVQQRAFGHGIFMQGDADKTVIKNCLVEGRVRATKEMYEETNPYDLPFLSNYLMPHESYRALPTDEYHSLSEDAYRMYNIPGSITIENCVAKKMRGGFRLYLGGDAKVSNSTAVDCGLTNYNTQTGGEIINSSGNFTYTTLLNYRLNRKNTKVELTILPSPNATGPHNIADIDGGNHNITFHRTPGPLVKTDRAIVVTGSGSTIVNETEYTIILESTSSGNTITSCGPVINNGSGNNVTLSDCSFDITCSNTPDDIEAECYDDMLGIEKVAVDNNNSAVTNIQSGDWLRFNAIDLSGLNAVKALAASAVDGASIEIREGSISGDLLATIPVPNTGSLTTYEETAAIALDQVVDGAIDIFMVFTGSGVALLNLDEISFFRDHCFNSSFDPIYPIEAEEFCSFSGITVEELSSTNKAIASVGNDDYIVFPNVDFSGEKNYNSLEIYASCSSAGGTIEMRSGALDGTLLLSIDVSSTGSWNSYETFIGNAAIDLEGTHDVYFVFKGAAEELMKLDRFYFAENQCARSAYEAYGQIEAEDYCDMSGVQLYEDYYLGSIQEGDWIRFSNVDFTATAPLSVNFRIASQSSGGYANVMLDDPIEGTLISTVIATSTGSWTKWQEFLSIMNQDVTGVHDVYIYFGGGINIDWFRFTDIFIKGPTNPFERFEAEINDGEKGTVATATTDVDGNKELGSLEDGDYIMFSELNLEDANEIDVRVASAVEGGVIEVRLGSKTGEIIAFIDVPNTGSTSTWQTISTKVKDVVGETDVYFVFRGEGNDLFKLNWLQFTKYENPFDRLEAEDNDGGSTTFLPGATSDDADNGLGSILRFVTRENWLKFTDVDLTNAISVNARYASSNDDASIEVRLDAEDGQLIGTMKLNNTDSWSIWETASSKISSVSGVHDVYFLFKTESSSVVCSSNWFQFSTQSEPEILDPSSRIEAEDYSRESGTHAKVTSDVDGAMELNATEQGDWIVFENIDVTDLTDVDVRLANAGDGNRIELRIGSYDGTYYSIISAPNTGSVARWETVNKVLYAATGVQDVYLIFKGSDVDLMNINWLQFNYKTSGLSTNSYPRDIKIYPNPVQDQFTISNCINAEVEIFNSLGSTIFKGIIESDECQISMESLSKGVYIVQVREDKLIKNFKIIKQ